MAILKDRVYLTIVRGRIHSSTYDFTSWTVHGPPEGLECFGLTSYHSQLMVVGGKERGMVTNKVWTSDDGTDWQLSLPPMPNKRCFPLAVNTGPSPECVIVAGGEGEDHTRLTVVEVLLDGQWFTVPSKLTYLCDTLSHGGVVYFNNVNIGNKQNHIVHCQLQSLLAACTHQSRDSIPEQSTDLKSTFWQSIDLPDGRTSLAFFGRRLTINTFPDMSLYFHYPQRTSEENMASQAQQWVYGGELPLSSSTVFVATLPTEEMLVITTNSREEVKRVFKGSLKSEEW